MWYEEYMVWFIIHLLNICFALEKKQGCKNMNRFKGFIGKIRELQAPKSEAFNE